MDKFRNSRIMDALQETEGERRPSSLNLMSSNNRLLENKSKRKNTPNKKLSLHKLKTTHPPVAPFPSLRGSEVLQGKRFKTIVSFTGEDIPAHQTLSVRFGGKQNPTNVQVQLEDTIPPPLPMGAERERTQGGLYLVTMDNTFLRESMGRKNTPNKKSSTIQFKNTHPPVARLPSLSVFQKIQGQRLKTIAHFTGEDIPTHQTLSFKRVGEEKKPTTVSIQVVQVQDRTIPPPLPLRAERETTQSGLFLINMNHLFLRETTERKNTPNKKFVSHQPNTTRPTVAPLIPLRGFKVLQGKKVPAEQLRNDGNANFCPQQNDKRIGRKKQDDQL